MKNKGFLILRIDRNQREIDTEGASHYENEELNALKNEVEALNKKPAELTEEEMKQVSGGDSGEEVKVCRKCGRQYTGLHICRILE